MKVKSITYQLLSRCIDAVVCTECIKSSALPDLTKPNQTKPNAWCPVSSIATTLYHTLVHCYSFSSFIIAFKTLLLVLSNTFDLSSSWIFYLFFVFDGVFVPSGFFRAFPKSPKRFISILLRSHFSVDFILNAKHTKSVSYFPFGSAFVFGIFIFPIVRFEE